MRSGQQRRINSDDLHVFLGPTNDANGRETAKQMRIKVTGRREYCDGCGEANSIRRAIPREAKAKLGRRLQRVSIDLRGRTGEAHYCMLVMDDNTNVGWPLFLRDKSSPTLCHAFLFWHSAVKLVKVTCGDLNIARFDNGHEITNADFQNLQIELRIAVEYTPVDNAKCNARVERKLAPIAENSRRLSLSSRAAPHI